MSVLNIRIYPDPILKEPALPVEKFDAELNKLLDDMYQTMLAANGIGLAAPQIGVSKQIAVIDVSEERDQRLELINPKIIWEDGKVPSEEGCLSIPGYRDKLKRSEEIIVQAKDRNGKDIEIKADELLAICMQHEIDHLNGILFIDRLSRLKRELFKRWFKKSQAAEEKND
jgi:peptide deformylase